jgi:hypothetical protein
MKQIMLAFVALAYSQLAHTQSLNIDLYGGVANYGGDLQGKRLSLSNVGPALGVGISYNINTKLAVRGVASYMKVKGSDATSVLSLQYGKLN